jgi:hypothetical protein
LVQAPVPALAPVPTLLLVLILVAGLVLGLGSFSRCSFMTSPPIAKRG